MEQNEARPKASYFVTELVEDVNSIFKPKVNKAQSAICMEELNPSSSPERYRPSVLTTDLSISKVFNCLSLSRPLDEEDWCERTSTKRLKRVEMGKEGAEVTMKALGVIERKPKAKVLDQKVGHPRRKPLVDIQVNTSVLEVMMSQLGDIPVGVVSLDVDDHCSQDCDAILSILVSIKEEDDTFVWHYDTKGCYTVKSGYQEAAKQAHLGSNLPSSSLGWSEKEWRRCANTDCCLVCLKMVEPLEHLLFECEWTKKVWFGCGLGLRSDDLGRHLVKDWLGMWFQSLGTSNWGKTVICSLVWMAWTIWKARNDHLFNQCRVDPIEVIMKARRDEDELLATCKVPSAPSDVSSGVHNNGSG
ncbi:hypothetical protein LOK49_LG13G00159 [Camellia lanceoleosa]|uniref:Uncharacterized protein n=1 Tax=Camellia lanceoleosa TaxID=1840588 RepID=A0ACC0FGV1_9ERIC|nr:hypothetical protein LOK49_LG13G00159 [Camellia lanceoleosa]